MIKVNLHLFELVSELKVNFDKSSLFCINIKQYWLEEATNVLNYKVGITLFKYLGLPVGCNHRRNVTWKSVVDTVRSMLSSWNNKHISSGGRIILLKFVL